MKPKTSKMGRPKVPKDQAKGEFFSMRVTSGESVKINTAILKSGMKKSEWARQALIKATED